MEKHSYPPKLYELVLDSIVQTTCDAKPWAVFFESQDFICTLPPLVQVDFFEKVKTWDSGVWSMCQQTKKNIK